jgi:itaconyl-CoA hydratase
MCAQQRAGAPITEADNVWFTLLTMNTHLLHFERAMLLPKRGSKAT